MNKELFERFGINPQKIRYKKNIQIVEDQNGKQFVIKKNHKKKKTVYDYLTSRGFYHFPKVYTDFDEAYEFMEYLEDTEVDTAQRLEDMIYLLSILHGKTTFYKEIDLDKIKQIYEEMSDEYNYLFSYYQSIQSMIEEEVYMSPAYYYFILNSSKIYPVLEFGKMHLEHWYQLMRERKTLRFVLNHNHLDITHLLENKEPYLISWNLADFGFPENDLAHLFRKHYQHLEIDTFLSLYQGKYKLIDYEYHLFLAQICKLERLDLNQSEDEKMNQVTEWNRYLDQIYFYLLKENSKKSNQYPQH